MRFVYFSLIDNHKAVAETSPAPVPLPLRVEPKPKSGIRQQDLLKRVVEVKPKRRNVCAISDVNQSSPAQSGQPPKKNHFVVSKHEKEKVEPPNSFSKVGDEMKSDNPVKSLLAAYQSSDDDED
ncbi:Ypt/Rab-GAP domain of gyp1p superfamily protein [Striga asiatica]|uniref:Ypt/Rab-GAP domain of gyp1p superfamily protein n=1 Tax=Striga asiatica TaxID=4170 RepID=A0A5A7Q0R0_STRAF|nr:Ypt/Rab-GAP domain of gyp1p superfamily protein [Striga asiatica]